MGEANLDVLIIENNNNSVGGYVQWFTGIPALSGMPLAVVFPRDDEMTIVSHGSLDTHRVLNGGDGVWRGVKAVHSTAFFPAVDYTRAARSKLLLDALAPFATSTIGLVAPFQMLYATVEDIRQGMGAARFVNAAEVIDSVKVVKSAEEIEMIRRTAAIQDAAFEAALTAIEPGKTDREVAATAHSRSIELGSDQGFVLCASSAPGTPAPYGPSHLQARVIEEGDVIAILVENSGPEGMWSELGRMVVVGRAPDRMLEDFAFALEAQAYTLRHLVPGAAPSDIWTAYNDYMREHGRPEERRIHCHGQGYDLVERPLIRDDETLRITENLNVACHPSFNGESAFCSVCDGFIVTAGGVERLHRTEQRVFEL